MATQEHYTSDESKPKIISDMKKRQRKDETDTFTYKAEHTGDVRNSDTYTDTYMTYMLLNGILQSFKKSLLKILEHMSGFHYLHRDITGLALMSM